MKLNKNFHHIIYIFAFIYLVLCPAVHQLDDAVNHDIVIKNEARLQQKECHKNVDSNLIKIFNSFLTEPLSHPGNEANHAITLSPVTPLSLSVLSTVRLNL